MTYYNNQPETIDGMSMNSKLEINKQYGGVNVVSIGLSNVEGENVTLKDDIAIQELGREVTIKIDDNPFVYTQELREQVIEPLFNYLKGFTYIPTKFQYKPRFYLDSGDTIQVENIKNNQFVNSIVLNQHIKIPYARQSLLENPALTETQVKNKYISKAEQANSHTEITVDKANKTIKSITQQIGDRSDKTTTITQEIDGLHTLVEDIEDLTLTVEGNNPIPLTNCAEGYIYELHIYGNNTSFKPLYPSKTLYPSTTLYPASGKAILEIINQDNIKEETYLGFKGVLRQNGSTYDEYILKDNKAQIIRRINENGSIKVTPTIEDLGNISIPISNGNNVVNIKSYTSKMKITYITKSNFSDIFAPNVTMKAEFDVQAQQIKGKVSKDDMATEIALNYEAVMIAWNKYSEYIQFLNENNLAQIQIKDSPTNKLMSLNKNGQEFYKNNELIGKMGVHKDEEGNGYIAFSVPINNYNTSTKNGMAWGITTPSGNFYPIFNMKNFYIGAPNSGEVYGQLELVASDLVLGGYETGLVSGRIRMIGDDINNGMIFMDTETGDILLSIYGGNDTDVNNLEYPHITMLNNIIEFFRNAGGSNSFRIGGIRNAQGGLDGDHCTITDDGSILITDSISAKAGTFKDELTSIHTYGNIDCDKYVYAQNIQSDVRLKTNIKDCEKNALEIIDKFNIKSFDWKDKSRGHINLGFIAQEVEKIDQSYVLKRPVYNDKKEKTDEEYYINELPILSTAIKSIQELHQIVNKQQEEIEYLKEEINRMKGENNAKN